MACPDSSRGIPLYRRIATTLAYRIATGQLRAGVALPPLRAARSLWGVNLHTVRRAYLELQAAGLVRIARRGDTVVLGGGSARPSTLRELVARLLEEGRRDFGASAKRVFDELRDVLADRARVCVAECSRTLAGRIASQLAATWRVTAVPYLLSDDVPHDAPVVSTYFHVAQLHERWGACGADLHFVHIRPPERFVHDVRRRLREISTDRVTLCETDRSLALVLAAELGRACGPGTVVSVVTPPDIVAFLDAAAEPGLRLISPRHWDRLPDARRVARDILALDYDIEPSDLGAIGRRLGWHRRDARPEPEQNHRLFDSGSPARVRIL